MAMDREARERIEALCDATWQQIRELELEERNAFALALIEQSVTKHAKDYFGGNSAKELRFVAAETDHLSIIIRSLFQKYLNEHFTLIEIPPEHETPREEREHDDQAN